MILSPIPILKTSPPLKTKVSAIELQTSTTATYMELLARQLFKDLDIALQVQDAQCRAPMV